VNDIARFEKISRRTSDALGSLRLHWPEYLMEVGELGSYMFFVCAAVTLFQHPAMEDAAYHLCGKALRTAEEFVHERAANTEHRGRDCRMLDQKSEQLHMKSERTQFAVKIVFVAST
jgi:hypothetical protein